MLREINTSKYLLYVLVSFLNIYIDIEKKNQIKFYTVTVQYRENL